MSMAEAVYILCAATAGTSTAMLLRGYRRNGIRLLLWAALCFGGLTLNNVLLYVDLVLFPSVDLSPWRSLCALAGLGVLLFGLVWEDPRQ